MAGWQDFIPFTGPREGESRANAFMRNVGGMVNPLRTQQENALYAMTPEQREAYAAANPSLLGWVNQKPVDLAAEAAQAKAAPAPILDLTPRAPVAPASVPSTTSQVGQVAAAGAKPDYAGQFGAILGQPVTVTSTKRSAADNARVGGAKNSMHMTGEAADLVLADMSKASRTAAVLALKAQGFTEAIDEGDHVHVGWRGGPVGTAAPTVPLGSLTVPGVQFVDPVSAMAMLPQPQAIPGIDLPNAPTLEAPAARPSRTKLNAEALMAPMTEATKVKPRDGQYDAWDRVAAGLQQAATGASRSGATGIGDLILAAGGGFGGGFSGERKEQAAEIKANEAETRAAKIAMAKMGFDIALTNEDIQWANDQGLWQSGEDARGVRNQNVLSADQRQVQEALANQGILAQNIGANNNWGTQRAQVGLSALQGAAGATNTANTQQLTINAAADKADGKGADLDALITAAGLDPKDTKNPMVAAARGTAAAIKAGNLPLAVQGVASDLVTSGLYKQALPEDVVKEIDKDMQRNKGAGSVGLALSTLQAFAKQDPQGFSSLVNELALAGNPSAKMLQGAASAQPAK